MTYAYYSRLGQACFVQRIGPVTCHTAGEAVKAAYGAGVRTIWLDDADDWRAAVELARTERWYLVTRRAPDDTPPATAAAAEVYAIGARPNGGREITIMGPPALAAWGLPSDTTWIDLQTTLASLNIQFNVEIGDGVYTPAGLAIDLIKRWVHSEHLVPHESDAEIALEWRRATHELAFLDTATELDPELVLYLYDRRSAYLTVASDTSFGIGALGAAVPGGDLSPSAHYLAEVSYPRTPPPERFASLRGLRSGSMTSEYVRIAIAAGAEPQSARTRMFAAQAGVFRTWAGHLWDAREAFRGTLAEPAVKTLALTGLGWACRNRPALWARIVNENARRVFADSRRAPGVWIGASTDATLIAAPPGMPPILAKPGRGGYTLQRVLAVSALADVAHLAPARAFVALARMDSAPGEAADETAIQSEA